MITPNQVITIPSQTADGIWISSLTINAPTPTGKISCNARLIPYNVESGSLFPTLTKNIFIQDIMSSSISSPEIGEAMESIMGAIQSQIISKSLF